MATPETPDDVRITYFLDAHMHTDTLEQRDQYTGRRIRIRPRTLTVNYWYATAAEAPRWYVSIEGRIVRVSDDAISRRDARVAYWAEHEQLDHDIANAPEWVQQLIAAAHLIVLGPSA